MVILRLKFRVTKKKLKLVAQYWNLKTHVQLLLEVDCYCVVSWPSERWRNRNNNSGNLSSKPNNKIHYEHAENSDAGANCEQWWEQQGGCCGAKGWRQQTTTRMGRKWVNLQRVSFKLGWMFWLGRQFGVDMLLAWICFSATNSLTPTRK